MRASRRSFLAGTTAATVGLAAGVPAFGVNLPKPQREAAFKLSSQLHLIPGKSDDEKLAKMRKWGFEGVELGGEIVGREQELRVAVAKAGLRVSAICWGSADGSLVSEVPEKRKGGIEAIKRVLASAGELESTGVIYVPAFNGQTKLTNQEIRQLLLDTFPAIGEYAVSVKSRVLLEPLNRGEAFFLRQVADGAAICRDINSPGIQMMGDFYHMGIEETSDLAAFLAAGDYLHHVHLASRSRVLPGQDERSFVDGFRGLKLIGFQEYCSFECGCKGDKEAEFPKSIAFLRKQWEKA